MSIQAQLATIVWLPIVFYLFTIFPPRKAVIVSFIGGLLFLPEKAGFALPLIPDYTGMVATCYGIVLAIFIYDAQHLSSFKPSWFDLPMLIWCICPVFSSLTNDLGTYDGINEAITQTVTWGLPYFLGRLYLNNLDGLRELAINIVKGGLIYVPLCLYEGRMSPQLHKIFYGYYAHPSGIAQSYRLGGYRPMVFMQHGLMVGMWMMLVTLVAFWLWKAQAVQTIWNMPMDRLVILCMLTFIWCRSTGTYGYMLYSLVVLFTARWLRTSLPLLLLIAGISYFLYASAIGTFNSDAVVSFAADVINPDRAQSLEFRFDNEEILAEHARDRMIFGWGGWGRNRVYEENWDGIIADVAVTDSLWILAFGINGVVGLVSLTASLLLPVIKFCLLAYPAKTWFNPKVAPAAALAVALLLFMLDCLLNHMFNPVFPLISGGLSGSVSKETRQVTINTNYKFKNRKKII